MIITATTTDLMDTSITPPTMEDITEQGNIIIIKDHKTILDGTIINKTANGTESEYETTIPEELSAIQKLVEHETKGIVAIQIILEGEQITPIFLVQMKSYLTELPPQICEDTVPI